MQFSPTVYLVPEIIKYDDKHTIIHVHVPPSAEVHSFKRVIYDRVDDADEYSYDFGVTKHETNETKHETNETKPKNAKCDLTEAEEKLVILIKENPSITQKKLHEKSEIPLGTIKRILPVLQKKGVISREGNNRTGRWIINYIN